MKYQVGDKVEITEEGSHGFEVGELDESVAEVDSLNDEIKELKDRIELLEEKNEALHVENEELIDRINDGPVEAVINHEDV